MAITYVAGTNTITVTGYTEATPCTFLDIYNADVAGGWGVVTRPQSNTYIIQALLHIGDGSTATWFKDTLKVVIQEVTGPTGWRDTNWYVQPNAHFQLGTLDNESNKQFRDGCIIYFDATGYHCFLGYGDTKLYASCFYNSFSFCVENDGRVWGCQLVNMSAGSGLLYCRADWYQVNIYHYGWGFYQPSSLNVFTNLVIDNQVSAFRLEGVEVTARNIKIRNCTYVAYTYYSGSDYSYFIDFDVDNWNFLWYIAPNARIYRQYSFDLKVIDKDGNAIDGATVKIWDKDDNLVVDTTTSSGVIATHTLNYGYYDQAGGNTPTMQTPHIIQISKAGYQTYEKKFTVDEIINWRIRLLQANPVQFLDGNPILQICPESQEDDQILFEVI